MQALAYSACHVAQMALIGKERYLRNCEHTGLLSAAHLISATIACVAKQCFKSLQTDHNTLLSAQAQANIVTIATTTIFFWKVGAVSHLRRGLLLPSFSMCYRVVI